MVAYSTLSPPEISLHLSFVFSAGDLRVLSCPLSQLKPYAKRPLNFPENGPWNIRLASVCHLYCFSCFHNLRFSQWQMHTGIVADRITIFLLGFDAALWPAALGCTKGCSWYIPKFEHPLWFYSLCLLKKGIVSMSPHELRSSPWIRLFLRLKKAKRLISYLKMAFLIHGSSAICWGMRQWLEK